MKCPEDCPVLTGFAETITRIGIDIDSVENDRLQNEASMEQNRATASQLALLPNTPDVIETRTILQEAVILAGEAHEKITESLRLSNAALDANMSVSNIIFSKCQGKPSYIEDPSRPGNMILSCASPGVREV